MAPLPFSPLSKILRAIEADNAVDLSRREGGAALEKEEGKSSFYPGEFSGPVQKGDEEGEVSGDRLLPGSEGEGRRLK